MNKSNQVMVYLDPAVLLETDTYRAELRRAGTVTTRSALVNTALLYYLEHVRAEEAARAALAFRDRLVATMVEAAAVAVAQPQETAHA